jgi:hypothetical protein
MLRVLMVVVALASLALLAMVPFAFEEIRWRNWNHGADNNLFRIVLVMSPIGSLALCYFAWRENLISLVQLTLQRRRLEAEKSILETQRAISEMAPKVADAPGSSEFVRLWTAASVAPSYDKAAWKAVERHLLEVGAI